MGLVVLAIRFISPGNGRRQDVTDSKTTGTGGDESMMFLDRNQPLCATTLGGFLAAGTSEERNQFVADPVDMAGKISRYYDLNPSTRIDPQAIKIVDSSLLDLPGGRAVEIRWITDDGRKIDCVFVRQNDEWRLDWQNFVQYSDYPWSLFLAGDGKSEAEFRLLVRERLAVEHRDFSFMSLVFYAPRFGHPDQEGPPSPEFSIRRDSTAGRILTAAFERAEKEEPFYGSKLASWTPQSMIPVRVRIRRLPPTADSDIRFELVEVVACHWLGIDDLGVTPK